MKDVKEIPDEQTPPAPADTLPITDTTADLETLVKEMPEPVPDAINAAAAKEDQVDAIQKGTRDRLGRLFDPGQHKADPVTGEPVFTPKGAFSKLRLPKDNPSGPVLPEATRPTDQKIKLAAGKLADVFIITGISFFGDEWKPEIGKGFDERMMLVEANERWMNEHGYVEPPAWIDLALAYGLYAGKRMTKPTTKGRMQKIWDWTKNKTTNLWLRLTGQKIKIVPTDTRG